MPTAVHDLMSAPPVTCTTTTTLAEATALMDGHRIGSLVVADGLHVAGIVTERDLLRASAHGADASRATVAGWMTADPDVLGPDDALGAAWTGLAGHHYRHLPVVDRGDVVGVVSMRDLLAAAPAPLETAPGLSVPAGLEGVAVAETSIGDVDGTRGFFHYRQYSAVELAGRRSLEDVWQLVSDGHLPPDPAAAAHFAAETAGLRSVPPETAALLPRLAALGAPLDALRTAVSLVGAELAWPPSHDAGAGELRDEALRLCAVTPTLVAALHRLRRRRPPVDPRPDLGLAANYLWMLHEEEAAPAQVRALEQYLILTVDHGFNASTFTARVITSTGADLAAAVVGAIGALSGPLHGGAPSRALDMLDAIGTAGHARAWVTDAVDRGERIMGFGHRVYRGEDPRATFLRGVAAGVGGELAGYAAEVEKTVVDVLAERKPGRRLDTNVEFYAGVVMHSCGIPRELFTPTFAASRTIGWTAHLREQAAAGKLIRPAARYVGPPPPQPVPAA